MIRLYTTHYLTGSQDWLLDSNTYRRLDPKAWEFLKTMYDEGASHVAVATLDGAMTGWFRCTLEGSEQVGTLYAQGTWVAPKYRRQGLATALWSKALEKLQPKRVNVDIASANGRRLIRGLKTKYPSLLYSANGLSSIYADIPQLQGHRLS